MVFFTRTKSALPYSLHYRYQDMPVQRANRLPAYLVPLFSALLLFFSTVTYAQPTECGNIVCTANDVRIKGAYIASASNTPITCTQGSATQAYIYLRVYSKAGREGVYFSANLKINGVVQEDANGDPIVISNCFSDNLKAGEGNVLKIPTQINFTCGDALSLTNVYVAYSQNGNQCVFENGDPKPNQTCPGAPSKCRDQVQAGDPDIVIEVPQLVIGFSSTEGSCTGNSRLLNFTATASGGTPPYTFSIDYGDGSATSTFANTTSPKMFSHSYVSGASYVVTLTVTDAGGANVQTSTLMPTIEVTPCCYFAATCKANNTVTKVQGCSTNALPDPETDPTAIFENITDNPCGTLVLTSIDNSTGSLCPDGISITRTYRLFEDLDGDGEFDTGDEQSATCVRYYKIVDETAPTGSAPSNVTDINSCKPTQEQAEAAFDATLAAGGYSDDCGGTVTAVLTNVVVSGTNCAWTVTYSFSVEDGCDNVLASQSYQRSGGDKTAPVLKSGSTIPAGQTDVDACKANAPAGPTAAEIAALYEDACGGAIAVTKSGTPTGTNCSWSVTYTYEVKDACGNVVATSPTVSYSGGDNTAPIGTAPSNITGVNSCKPSQMTAAAAFNATSAAGGYSDNCGGTVTAMLTSTDVTGTNCAWTVTYTFKVKDACNNELTDQTYTRSGGDKTAPALTGTLPTGATNQNLCFNAIPAGPTVAQIAALYTDNCGTVHVTKSGTPTGNSCRWSVTYQYAITDDCNNAATSVNITYSGSDQTKPEITITNYQATLGCNPTQAQINAAFGTASATDNCDQNVMLTSSLSSITKIGCQWSQKKTWTATDDCNNVKTAYKTVTWTVTPKSDCYSVFLENRTFNATYNKTTFRFKVCANGCPNAVSYIAFIHSSSTARVLAPANGSTYNYPVAPNIAYKVVTPPSSTQKGVKYETIGEGIKNTCDYFEFTLSGDQRLLPITVQVKAGTKVVNIVVNPNCYCQQPTSNSTNSITTMAVEENVEPAQLSVFAYPNPFSNSVRFTVANPKAGQGSLEVFNMLGQKVKTIYRGFIPAGSQNYQMSAAGLQNGNLIYRLSVGNTQVSGKLMRAKE